VSVGIYRPVDVMPQASRGVFAAVRESALTDGGASFIIIDIFLSVSTPDRLRSWSSRRCAPRTRPSARSSGGHKMLPQASAMHGAERDVAYAQLTRQKHPSNPAWMDSRCADVMWPLLHPQGMQLPRRFLSASEPLLGGGGDAVRRVLDAEAGAAEAQRGLAAARIASDEAARCGGRLDAAQAFPQGTAGP